MLTEESKHKRRVTFLLRYLYVPVEGSGALLGSAQSGAPASPSTLTVGTTTFAADRTARDQDISVDSRSAIPSDRCFWY
jgi:hypothetical protein